MAASVQRFLQFASQTSLWPQLEASWLNIYQPGKREEIVVVWL